jgi:hypothetical protein
MNAIRSTRFRRMAPAAVALAAVVVIAGCGGGSSSSSGGESSASGASGRFAVGVEAACRAANEQIAALGTPQQAQVFKYLQTTESVIGALHKEAQSLAGSGAAEQKYATALGEAVTVLNEMSNAALSENYDAVRELSDKLIELQLGKVAEAAELKTCAEVPVTKS